MKALTAAAILAADDLATEALEVPQWGGTVHVRELSLGERMQLGELAQTAPDTVACWLVAVATTDAGGDPLFPQDDLDGVVAQLKKRNTAAVNLVSGAVLRLSGLVAPGADVEAAAEEAAGN